MNKQIKYFLKRVGIFLVPFFIVLISFFILDPFKILYEYKNYSGSFIQLNRDVISSKTLIKNYDKYKYNSFIFGSSRTVAFKTWDWKNHLDSSGVLFSFDASNENIFGMLTKIKYLNDNHIKIDNALLVVCSDATFLSISDLDGPLYIKYPDIASTNQLNFYLTFISSWFDKLFFVKYIDYKFFQVQREYSKDIIEPQNIDYDDVYNNFFITKIDRQLKSRPDAYYSEMLKDSLFYKKQIPAMIEEPQINDIAIEYLREMAGILKHNNTNYKLVISPLYNTPKFNITDYETLVRIFGSENVFDFSGENSITSNYRNYYERSHYRPEVGRQILEIIYSDNAKSKINQLTQN
ncbi:MAG: hypothetical protein IPI19_07635 [Ignavibacteriales bacterium]|nr:hypothetical protein [Ignavibacteriales bacterium]